MLQTLRSSKDCQPDPRAQQAGPILGETAQITLREGRDQIEVRSVAIAGWRWKAASPGRRPQRESELQRTMSSSANAA